MNYVGRFLSSVKTFYSEINPATLTGAIDVIVVEQEDGSLLCSPFHVRFGKMGVLRSREKVVYIEINGEQVNLHMKLGENGEAFFLEEAAVEDQVPAHLCSSPLVSSSKLMEDGMKRLHAEAKKARSQTESSKESDTSLGTKEGSPSIGPEVVVVAAKADSEMTQSSEGHSQKRVLEARKEPESESVVVNLGDTTQDESVAITVETEIEQGQSKRQLQFESASQEDEEAGRGEDGSPATAKETLLRIENETKTGRRAKVTKKRKRRSSGAKQVRVERPATPEALPTKSSLSRRLMNLSESSTSSSSQHSDDDAIFQIEDVSEEEVTAGGFPTRVKGAPSDVWAADLRRRELLQVRMPQHPLSDGELTPGVLSPLPTRPPTPKSDTEVETMREERHHGKSVGHMRSASSSEKIEWNWGELPGRRLSRSCSSAADVEIFESLPVAKPEEGGAKKDEEEEGEGLSVEGVAGAESGAGPVGAEEEEGEEEQSKADDKKSVWSKLNVFRNIQHSQGVEKGMYLQDLASEEIDPEVYALYFPERVEHNGRIDALRDEDKSSDLGNSLPQSPNTVEGGPNSMAYGDDSSEPSMNLQISLCGGLKDDEENVSPEDFMKQLVTYDEFCKSPGLLSNPNLVVRFEGKYYNWQAAGPIVISYLAFQRPLPDPVVTNLMKDQVPKGKRSLTSWLWGTSKHPTTPTKKGADSNGEASGEMAQEREESRQRDDTVYWSDETESSEKAAEQEPVSVPSVSSGVYKKSLRLSSEQLAKLNLKPGPNEVRYSVTTKYQGTAACESTIYLWKHNSKVIISDIDGTITRSDVFGQILPVLGKDWTHGGVAQLFSQIQSNGFLFLYLSARAIGQARHTKGFLKSVCQDKFALPDGPLLLNPSSLIRAFHREVIIKKPEEFKIRCLKDIQSLFPSTSNNNPVNPFYAGFGNRINDTWAYRAVGIPVSRIFTINSQGKVTHDHSLTFQSSYPKMQDLVDHVFPSLHREKTMAFVSPDTYSSFTFWREPVQTLPDEDDLVRSLTSKDKK